MKKKGSISIFLACILMSVVLLESVLVEIVRLRGLQIQAQRVATIATENMFSEYNQPLYEQYGIMLFDMNYGGYDSMQNRNQEFVDQNTILEDKNRVDFYQLQGMANITEYGVITDQNGAPLIKQGAYIMKTEIPKELLSKLSGQADSGKEVSKSDIDIEKLAQEGTQALKTSKQEQQAQKEKQTHNNEEQKKATTVAVPENADNPLEVMKEWKTKGILSLVVDNEEELSSKAVNTSLAVSKRALKKGTSNCEAVTATERILYLQYLMEHFSNYEKPSTASGLAYEMEYILCGKDSDMENLKGMVERLIAFREVENFVAIQTDATKVAQAESLAISLAGATVNPAIILSVQLGIMAAWAYVESILDVRTLLSGGKIAFIKNSKEWTSDVFHLASCIANKGRAIESENGISYKGYLFALLAVLPQKNLGLRPLDLMEYTLHQLDDYQQIKMDEMVYQINTDYHFNANPLFSAVIPSNQVIDDYSFSYQINDSYLN